MKLFIRLIISLSIGLGFLYLTFKDIQFEKLTFSWSENTFYFIILYIMNFVMITFLRSLRSFIVFRNLGKLKLQQMFTYTSVGYSFIVMLPFRMGELLIPLFIKKNTGIALSSSLIVIMFERFLDLFMVLISLIYIVSTLPLPDWLIKSSFIAISVFTLILITLLLSYKKSHLVWKLMLPVINLLNEKTNEKIRHILKGFKEGFRNIKTRRTFFMIFGLSLIIMMLSMLSIFYVLKIVGIEGNLVIAATVLILNLIGISIPAGPAMIGNYQYSCIVALSLFSIDKNQSFIFANLYYLLGIGMTIILGILFYPTVHFTLEDIKNAITMKQVSDENDEKN